MYRFKGPVCKIGRIKPKWNINRIVFIRVSKSNVPETKSCICCFKMSPLYLQRERVLFH